MESADNFSAFMWKLGWNCPSVAIPQCVSNLSVKVNDFVQKVDAFLDSSSASPDELIVILRSLLTAVGEISSVSDTSIPSTIVADEFRKEFPRQLIREAVLAYLLNNRPFVSVLLSLLGVVSIEEISGNTRPVHDEVTVDWERLFALLIGSFRHIATTYRWGESDFHGEQLLNQIANLTVAMGCSPQICELPGGTKRILARGAIHPELVQDWVLMIPICRVAWPKPETLLGVGISVIPESDADLPGLAAIVYGASGTCFEMELSEGLVARARTEGDLSGLGIFVRPGKHVEALPGLWDAADETTGSAVKATLNLELEQSYLDGSPKVLLSTGLGSVTVQTIRIVFEAKGGYQDGDDLCVECFFDRISVAITPGDSTDSFVAALLPNEGVTATIDLNVQASRSGLSFGGSGSLEVALPLHFAVGPIEVMDIKVGLKPSLSTLVFNMGGTISATLGPVNVVLKGLGLGASIDPSIPDLSIAATPPVGVGLSISAGGLFGGGFLDFDNDNKRYSGALALRFGEIALAAIGIITTKMPDGGKFSLLISICATFTPPIQLSFGFTLSGVGGLIGINRRMDVEALRTGLKAGTLGSILFPDPESLIPNAARIISDMGTAFPVQEGRYVVGPMVKLGWGSPNIITADVGIFLELPEPVKAVILGQLVTILPEKTNPQIVIRLDVLGVLEFSKRQLTFQAALYDSTVMGYPVSGDSAFLLGWGDDPRFALSLGGFHPRFTAPEPPTVFANLRRLSIDICANSSLHLTCAAYQALTPNSLQFGAQLDLHAEKAGAKLTGHLGFDTLIYFSPFSFDVTMNAKVKISYGGETFAAIEMTLWLSGPRPWVGRVKAKIKLLFITVPIKFAVTWGDETPIPIAAVDPWLDVQRVLQLRESWSSSLPAGKTMVEVLRGDMVQDEQLVLHPLGRLEVRQKVPLGMVLSRASSAPITGHNRFEIESVMVGDYEINKSTGLVPVEEFFARGQWEDLGDRALSVPSFEKMQAGVAVSTGAVQICGDPAPPINSEYETIFIDENRLSSTSGPHAVPKSMMAGVLDARIKRDARRRAGPQSRFVCKPSAFTVLEEGYSVADADSVTRSDKTNAQHISRMKADQSLCALPKASPAKACFVVPDYEVVL
ncbi:DUF6603 domain-containing protein [Candidatus Propionivibrio aalborgensis]|uniref:DUF6603 domain-containing protein n=1 Tax=Candidatus Propionivibrio aalborgensis TaxID=1860101 RepID=UPI00164974B9|nr:DUF6603 domain-containing protein [Candidatus Propionivibrio aalborgensis]